MYLHIKWLFILFTYKMTWNCTLLSVTIITNTKLGLNALDIRTKLACLFQCQKVNATIIPNLIMSLANVDITKTLSCDFGHGKHHLLSNFYLLYLTESIIENDMMIRKLIAAWKHVASFCREKTTLIAAVQWMAWSH